MPPVVSVVTNLYNRADFIAQAIQSVRAQTFKDWEMVIVDDGSTDDSVAVARDAAEGDQRVRILEEPHRGMVPALSHGCKEACGRYLGWLDSDDMLADRCLERTVAALEAKPKAGMVYTQYKVIDDHGRVKGLGSRCNTPYTPERLLVEFMVFHFRLMRIETFRRVGGVAECQPMAPDYDMCLRISEVSHIIHLPEPLYFYRVHAQSVSWQKRLEQIDASRQAVEAALERRGMTGRYELEVEILSRFRIKKKA